MKKQFVINLVVGLFFLALLGIGLKLYPDYGMSWDETSQLDLGTQNYRYIFKGDPALTTMRDRWYGPLFEILLVALQSRGNDAQVFLSRHLLTFLAFFGGCVGFYFLCQRFTKNRLLALICTACLILSPRIFADAFYNSKDIPFLVFYVFGLFSLLWFLDSPTWRRGLIHALFTAALITIRLPGIILIALILFGLGIEILCKRTSLKNAGINFGVYLLVSSGLMILFWPALWVDPLHGFIEAFHFMSRFPHLAAFLYLGKTISSTALPWHYIPVWIAVTTPLLYLIGFLVGIVSIVRKQISIQRLDYSVERRDEVIVLAAIFAPLLAVILLKSVLYDGWRQMFFIYPPILLVAAKGMQAAFQWLSRFRIKHWASIISVGILALGLLPIGGWMITNHPYQNVYFNRLAGKDLKTIQQRFAMDYWGLGYRQGLEALAQMDSGEINLYVETIAGQRAIAILPPEDARRIHVVSDLTAADYYIGNYSRGAEIYPFKMELYSVDVGNAKIISVFKMSDEEKN